MQYTDTLMMVRPAAFAFNEETAAHNFFQHKVDMSPGQLQQQVLAQFDGLVSTLRRHGVEVLVIEDQPLPPKPDAIFPNNWISTNKAGIISLFPMCAQNRRAEKRDDILEKLQQQFVVEGLHDWSEFEAEAMYLEGTGSMVMDHQHKIIYACRSPRTHEAVLEKFAAANGYRAMVFSAVDENERPIYHTNVMMSIGDGFVAWCPKSITDYTERVAVAQLLEATGHEHVFIEPEQMQQFACNLLQVANKKGETFIVMSQTAFDALPPAKQSLLARFGKLLAADVSLIEKVNGGSVRCMLAEIFLEKRPAQ